MIKDIIYLAPFAIFGLITFIIIRNYFRQKFDSNDNRIDMLEEKDTKQEDYR